MLLVAIKVLIFDNIVIKRFYDRLFWDVYRNGASLTLFKTISYIYQALYNSFNRAKQNKAKQNQWCICKNNKFKLKIKVILNSPKVGLASDKLKKINPINND